MKVALLFKNYGPYHLSRLASAAGKCQEIGWQAVGIELARSQREYKWQTSITDSRLKIVSAVQDQELEQTRYMSLIRRLYAQLAQVNPDVIAIAGYAHPAMLATLWWCHLHGKPAVLFSESNEHDSQRYYWRERLKRYIVKFFKAALVGGRSNKRYLEKLGMSPKAIFCGYDVVGNADFHPVKIRTSASLVPQRYFLAVNRFVPKKNLMFLLTAYAAYRRLAGAGAWHLVLCGDGPLRREIEQHIAELELEEHITLPGFLQQAELLPYFAHADCFVHTSTEEQWGLVVNEAMAAGLPVLVSNRCGCFEDLIIDGMTGYGFDPTNLRELVNLMMEITTNDAQRETMQKGALEHIQHFSPACFADNLIMAVQYALSH